MPSDLYLSILITIALSNIGHRSAPEDGQLRQHHFAEDEGVLVVLRVEAVERNHLGAELLPDGVGREPEHVHLHVGPDLLVGEELTRDDPHLACGRHHPVYTRLAADCQWIRW